MDINNYSNYRQVSQFNQNNNGHHGNFPNAYQQNRPFIEQPNFTNNNNTLHNNLNNNLLSEQIVDYYVNIDSDDRKLDVYPNPFEYTVSFNPLGKSIDKTTRFKKNNININTEYPETPAPVISKHFKNVKYVKLDKVLLSKHVFVKYIITQTINITGTGAVSVSTIIDKQNCNPLSPSCTVCCSTNCCCTLSNNTKYVLLKVKELETYHVYSTNTLTSDNSFVLYVDKTLGNNNNLWFPTYGSCVYPDTLLNNINRLTIEFYDKNGNILSPKILVEYKTTINYLISTKTLTHCCLFGEFDANLYSKISALYTTTPIYSFKFTDFSNPALWYNNIYQQLLIPANLSPEYTVAVAGQIVGYLSPLVEYEKLLASLTDLDLTDKIKCISNNIFFIIGVVQNELNTMKKYDN